MSGNEWSQARAQVKKMREKGYTDQQIRKTALERGWAQEQIDELLPAATPRTPPPPFQPWDRPSAAARGFLRLQRAEGRPDRETRQKLGASEWSDEAIDRLLGGPGRRRGGVAGLTGVFDHPWLQRWSRALFAGSAVLFVLVALLLHEKVSDAAARAFLTASLFLFGFAMIALSKTLRSEALVSLMASISVHRFRGGRGGIGIAYGPWVTRALGSMLVGLGVRQIVYQCYLPHYPPKVAQSPAAIIGAIVALVVWVGTLFVFRGYEER